MSQSINRIRVWGIGLDNERYVCVCMCVHECECVCVLLFLFLLANNSGLTTEVCCVYVFVCCRDFGYVARDVTTRKHQCHVFRCAVPARAVAHLLLESHHQDRHRGHRSTSNSNSGGTTPTSPTGKEVGGVSQVMSSSTGCGAGVKSQRRRSLFEYFERITCTYIGSCEVGSSQGMELVNDAVATLTRSMENWQEVGVDITTSSITICDLKVNGINTDTRRGRFSPLTPTLGEGDFLH